MDWSDYKRVLVVEGMTDFHKRGGRKIALADLVVLIEGDTSLVMKDRFNPPEASLTPDQVAEIRALEQTEIVAA